MIRKQPNPRKYCKLLEPRSNKFWQEVKRSTLALVERGKQVVMNFRVTSKNVHGMHNNSNISQTGASRTSWLLPLSNNHKASGIYTYMQTSTVFKGQLPVKASDLQNSCGTAMKARQKTCIHYPLLLCIHSHQLWREVDTIAILLFLPHHPDLHLPLWLYGSRQRTMTIDD